MADPRYVGTGGLAAALAQGERLLPVDPAAAEAQAREILAVTPGSSAALRLSARALRRLGRVKDAERAACDAAEASLREPILGAATQALMQRRWQDAEARVRQRLAEAPDDAAALLMLAEIAAEMGAYGPAESLANEALGHAPRFLEARLSLARILFARGRVKDSLAIAEAILAEQPDSVAALTFITVNLGLIGAYEEAIGRYEDFLRRHDGDSILWAAYGHVLKTVGRTDEGVAAYRRALALNPASGDAWWSLANLKSAALGAADIEAMKRIAGVGCAGSCRPDQSPFRAWASARGSGRSRSFVSSL